MKKQDKNKLRDLKITALQERLRKRKAEAVKLRVKQAAGKVKDLHEYKKTRKEIAVIKTIIKEKQLQERSSEGVKK